MPEFTDQPAYGSETWTANPTVPTRRDHVMVGNIVHSGNGTRWQVKRTLTEGVVTQLWSAQTDHTERGDSHLTIPVEIASLLPEQRGALPDLETDCECVALHQQPDVVASYRAAAKASDEWDAKESKAFAQWTTDNPYAAVAGWQSTPQYEALGTRPQMPAAIGEGCVECDWTRRQLTPAGQKIMNLMWEYYGKRVNDLETLPRRVGQLEDKVNDLDQLSRR